MPTYPTTRRFFLDQEFRNENAAIAGLIRGLAQSQNYRYARDLKQTPADPKVFAILAWPWLSATTPLALRPVSDIAAGEWLNLAHLHVPDGRAPYASVKVHVAVKASGTVAGSLIVTNNSTTDTTEIDLSGTYGASTVWKSGTVLAKPGDMLWVSARNTGSVAFSVHGLSAFWDPASLAGPSSATFNAPWAAMSQEYSASGAPLSTHLLRWLGRMSNAVAYQRPQQVAASWFYNPAAGTGAGYSTVPLVVGRYMVQVGGRCPGLEVELKYRASGACTVEVALSGGATGTVVVPGAGRGTATATVALTPGDASEQELTLTVAGSPAYCDVEHVFVYEQHATASSLALPSGETITASFSPNLDERLMSGWPIIGEDIARMVMNEVWLWAYRRDRVLVNDCRFTYDYYDHVSFTGAAGVTDSAAVHAFRTSKWNTGDAFGELRIRSGYHQTYADADGSHPWKEWLFQVGIFGFADLAGSPAMGLSSYVLTSVRTEHTTEILRRISGLTTYQHARGGTLARATTYQLDSIMLVDGHTTDPQTTRPSWLTVEELPMGSPALTYP